MINWWEVIERSLERKLNLSTNTFPHAADSEWSLQHVVIHIDSDVPKIHHEPNLCGFSVHSTFCHNGNFDCFTMFSKLYTVYTAFPSFTLNTIVKPETIISPKNRSVFDVILSVCLLIKNQLFHIQTHCRPIFAFMFIQKLIINFSVFRSEGSGMRVTFSSLLIFVSVDFTLFKSIPPLFFIMNQSVDFLFAFQQWFIAASRIGINLCLIWSLFCSCFLTISPILAHNGVSKLDFKLYKFFILLFVASGYFSKFNFEFLKSSESKRAGLNSLSLSYWTFPFWSL